MNAFPRLASAALAAAILGVCACDPSPSPTATSTIAATPTLDIRVAAADAYLQALTGYDAALSPVNRDVCDVAATLPLLKSCWSQKLAIQRSFDRTFAAITFPADLGPDVQTMRYVVGRLESSTAAIAAAPDPARDLNDLGVFSSASVDFLQASSNLREDLGIIATPSA